MIGHVGIAAAEFIRYGLRDLGSGAARRHDRVHLLRDGRGAQIIRDLFPVGLRPVDHIPGLGQQFGMLREIFPLLELNPAFRPICDLPVPRVDLIVAETLGPHLGPDSRLHPAEGLGIIVEPLQGGFVFHDTVLHEHAFAFQQGPELHMRVVQDVPCGLEIGAALEVEVPRLGHLGEIGSDPLMLQRRVRGARLDTRYDLGGADPGPAQGSVDLRSHARLGEAFELALPDIGLRIDPALRGRFDQRIRAQPERLHVLDLPLDRVEVFLEGGPVRIGFLGDHALNPPELLGIEASQVLERLVFGHVDVSCSLHLAAPGQHFARAEERVGDVFAGLAGGLHRKRVVDGPGIGDLGQRPRQVLPHAVALARRAALVLGRVDLAGPGWVMHNPAIHPARGLQAHAILFGLLDHGEAEVVIVEAMVAPEEEELAFLRAAVQHQMRMGMIAVLMHRDDVVEMPRVGLEEPLGHIRRDVAHILPARADGERHEHMGRLAELGLEARVPPLGKALRQVLDVTRLELRLAIQEPATVHDMGGLGGEVIELVCEL